MAQSSPGQQAIDALVVGTPFADVVLTGLPRWPGPGEEVWAAERAVCAGGMANNAVVLARLGRLTSLAGTIGTDRIGDLVVKMLSDEANLSLDLLARDPQYQTPFTLAVGHAGDRSFLSHGDMPVWAPSAARLNTIRARTVLISLGSESLDWLAPMRAAGALVLASLAFDEHLGWSPSVLDRLADADILVCNDREALEYTREPTVEDALRALAARVPLAVVTLGQEGSLALGSPGVLPLEFTPAGADGITRTDAVAATAVDATGAGDAFISGLADAVLRPGARLDEALRHASLISSLVVSGLGGSASAPTSRQLLDRALELGPDFAFERDWFAGTLPQSPVQDRP